MDRIDALGTNRQRLPLMNQELFSEAEDKELTFIVEEAARVLSTPIALVTLVLDQIQFFKTHYGLPSELAVARGTDRDVSFCQFVVKTGQLFEVTDAEQDERVPQHLVQRYGIKAYLGIPVSVNDNVVGSLCVIDTQPRTFSEEERVILQKLAGLANQRLADLNERRKKICSTLLQRATQPALAELRDCLEPIEHAVSAGSLSALEAGPAIRLALHNSAEGTSSADMIKRALEATQLALSNCQSFFDDIQACVGDAGDSLSALENALTSRSATYLSAIAVSGRELARQNVEAVGGVILPDIVDDPVVSTPCSLAVSLVAISLSKTAAQMAELNLSGGLRMAVKNLGSQAEITISTIEPPSLDYSNIADEIESHACSEPTVAIQATDGTLNLCFTVAQTEKLRPELNSPGD